MLARTPLTEIEIEGVGTYRLPNMWQLRRINRLRGADRHTAALALGCGMTIRQFTKLPADKQAEVHRAYLALMSPLNTPVVESEPIEPRAVPRGHLSVDQKLIIGWRLLETKASLPRGHFGPWLQRQKGLSQGMAQQCMALARAYKQDKQAA